jgi:hypothetical protein
LIKKGFNKKAYELAYKYERDWRVCSQATIKALLDVFGIEDSILFKALSGFGAGCGLQGDGLCGAYIAGVTFLGFLLGRDISDIGTDPEDPRGSKKYRALNPLIKILKGKFIGNYSGIICQDIHRKIYGRPFYLLDPEESKKFESAGGHDWGCTDVCGNAAKWTVEILEEIKKKKV